MLEPKVKLSLLYQTHILVVKYRRSARYHARRMAPKTVRYFPWKQMATIKGMKRRCDIFLNSYVSWRFKEVTGI